MNRLHDPLHRPSERIWLHRTQWRTVAALMALLAAVVASLALASGFWWALHTRPVRTARVSPPQPPAPVATVTIPESSASVVEVYPLTAIRTHAPPIVVRSPGGTVTDLPVRIGQRVSAGELVARLEETAPAVRITRAPAPADAAANVARERAETGRLRRRLQQVRSKIQRLSAAAPPAERTRSGGSAQARAAAEQTAASVERAQRMLAAAAGRRRVVDQEYADRRVTRFQFHLARSRELVAEVELRRAEEEAEAARQALGGATVDERPAAAAQNRQQQIARLESEAREIQARLARVHVRVAAARQHLAPPAPPADGKHGDVKAARAPRNGTIAAILTNAGAKAARGTPLVAIELPERPRFRALVDRRVLSSLSPGARATLRGADGRSYTGRVARVEPVPDGTGFVEIFPPRRARLDGGAALVPPSPKPLPPTLPAAALIPGSRQAEVWLVVRQPGGSGGWVARRWPVRAAPAGRNRVAILAGLRPGYRVIVAGSHALRDGQPVAPVEVGSLSAG